MESPEKSKIPVIEQPVDHLSTVIKAVAVIVFLPLPLFLVFGAKTFLWMGIIVMGVAIIRFINSPVQLQRVAASPPPVAASVREPHQQSNEDALGGPTR